VEDNHVNPLEINPDFNTGGYPEHCYHWSAALNHQLNLNANADDLQGSVWLCPASATPNKWSYGYNAFGVATNNDTVSLGLGGHARPGAVGSNGKVVYAPPVSESEVASPGDMMSLGDGFTGSGVAIQDGNDLLWRTWTEPYDGSKRAFERHQGKANVVFCDGHVESPTLTFLFTDTSDSALRRWNRDHQSHRERLSP
jgi:prepilin-type processing-associated H-X9-DG protein